MPSTTPPSRHPGIVNLTPSFDFYSDSRAHGYKGPTRNVRLTRATTSGGGAIAKSEGGNRCVVAGKESLRILRFSEPSQDASTDHKSSVGRGGHRIDASRNFWDGSGLKIDSASTDVAWGHGSFNNKILTSARNGELIMWDLNKSGPSKYEHRSKIHIRSINKLSASRIVQHYCITGSADGDVRVWDLRDMSKSLMRIHHPTSVRGVVFSPSLWQPLQAVVGLDNGSIYRWDLKMGQRGQLDRLTMAHSGPVMALDWCSASAGISRNFASGVGEVGNSSTGQGWIVSGGLDRCVKVWDLTAPGSNTHIPYKPTYTLHPSFPVRRVIWRPSYECELAVVSNEESGLGSNADLSHSIAGTGPVIPIQRVSNVMGSDMPPSDGAVPGRDKHSPETKKGGGDAVEIWDVRQGWIAKWSVTGSAVEGGVTDVAFGDSHAIWAQHVSGMFSQIDLRDAMKPLDSITRVATTWEPSGSLAFIADKKSQWEAPYDDITPESQQLMEGRKMNLKELGNGTCQPTSQSMGTYSYDHSAQDLHVFSKLARDYVFEGHNRIAICGINADIASQAGKEKAALTWLLLGSLLTDLIPEPPPSPPPPSTKNLALPHSASAPAAIPSIYSFPSKNNLPLLGRSGSSEPIVSKTHTSPNHTSQNNGDLANKPNSRNLTPTSSTSSSPRRTPSALSPVATRQPSLLGPRESDTGLIRRPSDTYLNRRPSIFRPPSTSAPSTHSASPSDSTKSTSSLRHAGDGALADSDSSGSASGGGDAGGSSDEESGLRPLISPALNPTRIVPTVPSPLSRVAVQQWTEDEDDGGREDEASPSPGSTDTESGDSDSPRRRRKSAASRRSSTRMKSRSRSSTVASLAASAPRPLIKQASHTSIRTVTAGEISFREEDVVKGLARDDTVRYMRKGSLADSLSHKRQKSQALSEFVLNPDVGEEKLYPERAKATTDRRPGIVRFGEDKFRRIGWEALREAVEDFAAEGDVQMCALLSVVASQELRIGKQRCLRFLDSYIDLLTRLRLHASAAYLRKYSTVQDIRAATKLETIIYTSCGQCRKPIVFPAGAQRLGDIPRGGYSYCMTCRGPVVKCSICRLPVRTLLFQCPICTHGGHQQCYRRYYMERPMVPLPTSFMSEIRGRQGSAAKDIPLEGGTVTDDGTGTESSSPERVNRVRKLAGHPCAAGCGHMCWTANGPGVDEMEMNGR